VIRTSPDPNTARETLMSRDWPARDVAAMITLIDDPRHRLAEDGTARLSMEQARAILDLRLQRLTASGARKSPKSSTSWRWKSTTIWTFCARAPASRRSSRPSWRRSNPNLPPRARR